MIPRFVVLSLILAACGEAVPAESPAPGNASVADDADAPPRRGAERRQQAYLTRVRAVLKQGFVVQGTGLPADELKQLRGEASCQLDAAGIVVGCAATKPSGNAKFDAAVGAALEANKGKQTPPPPAEQPGWRTELITFSLRCGPDCS